MSEVLDTSVQFPFRQQNLDILDEFKSITFPTLTPTHIACHNILTGSALLIALCEYRCPAAWKDNFCQELEFLKQAKFIKPSMAP